MDSPKWQTETNLTATETVCACNLIGGYFDKHVFCFQITVEDVAAMEKEESLCNLEALIGEGPFTYIGLPMKWRGGTGSPITQIFFLIAAAAILRRALSISTTSPV